MSASGKPQRVDLSVAYNTGTSADPNPGSVVSDDHGDESLCTEGMARKKSKGQQGPRLISPQEVKEHQSQSDFWAVIDNFVVDATEFVDSHPGGTSKLLAANTPAAGATGKPFGFSFTRGRNAHFGGTGKRYREGVEGYLSSLAAEGDFLPPMDVVFKPHGKLVILGRLEGT